MKPEEIEARLERQRLRAPRPGLREAILARAAERRSRRRPWFAYAVTATIALSLLVGQIADRVQSRRLAALMEAMPTVAAGGRVEPPDMAALLRQQAEIDSLLRSPEWPSARIGG